MSPSINWIDFFFRRMCILTFHQNWVCFCIYMCVSHLLLLFVCWNLHYYIFFASYFFSVIVAFYAIHLGQKKNTNEQRELREKHDELSGNNHLYYWSWSQSMRDDVWMERRGGEKKKKHWWNFLDAQQWWWWWWWWELRVKTTCSFASHVRLVIINKISN